MSLQDHMFDVAAELKGKPGSKEFKKIITHITKADVYMEEIALENEAMREVIKITINKELVRALCSALYMWKDYARIYQELNKSKFNKLVKLHNKYCESHHRI